MPASASSTTRQRAGGNSRARAALCSGQDGCRISSPQRNAWQDFEPRCLHDSTLSFASHALFAVRNGLTDAAWRYFEKAAYLDLREIMGNTGKEGLHLACFGETWQAVIFGFAGLRFTPDGPRLSPHLPTRWQVLHFHFYWHGKLYAANLRRDKSGAVQTELSSLTEPPKSP